jgi:hypothetical protein
VNVEVDIAFLIRLRKLGLVWFEAPRGQAQNQSMLKLEQKIAWLTIKQNFGQTKSGQQFSCLSISQLLNRKLGRQLDFFSQIRKRAVYHCIKKKSSIQTASNPRQKRPKRKPKERLKKLTNKRRPDQHQLH